MLHLRSRCRLVRRARGSLFLGTRLRPDTARPAVEADSVDRCVIDYGLAIHVVNVGDVHMAHRGVVKELITLPMPTRVALTGVAVAVRDAAVEPDCRTPVPLVPRIACVAPPPISRGPEQAGFGWLHPSAGHPVVAVLTVAPVAGRPNPTLLNQDGLFVHRQFGRRERDGHGNLR